MSKSYQGVDPYKMQVMYALNHLINLLEKADPDETEMILSYLREAHAYKPEAPEPLMILAYLFYLTDASDYACGILTQVQEKGSLYRERIDSLITQLHRELSE